MVVLSIDNVFEVVPQIIEEATNYRPIEIFRRKTITNDLRLTISIGLFILYFTIILLFILGFTIILIQ